MNILFHKMRTGKKGQIASILTVTLVIFIITAFIVVNLGKRQIQDSKIRNAARAGVLAGGSTASVLLNTMSNLNDNMILNFAGFCLMVQYMIVIWIIDTVKVIKGYISMLELGNYAVWVDLALDYLNFCLTTWTIQLMIQGVYRTGDQLYKMIDELNNKLPRQSRDSARQYAFSNFGVDEPKIPFPVAQKSGLASNAWEYSLIETKFDTFMRLLPSYNKNDGDTSNGNRIEFFWDDSRTGHLVRNTAAIIIDPVQPVNLELKRLGWVSLNSGAVASYIAGRPGWLAPILALGVSLSPVVIALLASMCVAFTALTVVAAAMTVVLGIIAFAYCACAATVYGCIACCYPCTYYTGAAIFTGAMTAGLVILEAGWVNVYSRYNPARIPCFAMDMNAWNSPEKKSKFRIQVTATRTTNPSRINYGIYNSDWPFQTFTESGTVKGGGIFPPAQLFDISPHWNISP
jgi:hypothetical protein